MSRIIWVYGLIAGAVIVGSIEIGIVLGTGHGQGAVWFGYLVMLAALSLIFIGVKRYRDLELGGVIRFATALGVGLGIALVAGVVYVIGWEAYLWLTHYTFWDIYSKGVVDAQRASGASAADITRATNELAVMGKNYAKPLYRMVMTLFEILPVGVVIALISAALLRKSNFLPAHGNRSPTS